MLKASIWCPQLAKKILQLIATSSQKVITTFWNKTFQSYWFIWSINFFKEFFNTNISTLRLVTVVFALAGLHHRLMFDWQEMTAELWLHIWSRSDLECSPAQRIWRMSFPNMSHFQHRHCTIGTNMINSCDQWRQQEATFIGHMGIKIANGYFWVWKKSACWVLCQRLILQGSSSAR